MKKIYRVFVVILTIFALSACGKSVEQQIAEQLELGQRYLAEMKYDDAIVAFSKIIEMDPKPVVAYQWMAETYLAMDEKENAKKNLETGIQVYSELESNEQTVELTKAYEEIVRLLEMIIQEEQERYITELTAIQAAFETCESEKRVEYNQKIRELSREFEEPTFWKLGSGQYIGIYPREFVYCGEMADGKRNGFGRWWQIGSNGGYYLFEGNWEDDYPNGAGIEKRVGTVNTMIMETTYLDGYQNGTVIFTEVDNDDNDGYRVTFITEKGVAQVVSYDEDGEPEYNVSWDSFIKLNKHFFEGRIFGVECAMKE